MGPIRHVGDAARAEYGQDTPAHRKRIYRRVEADTIPHVWLSPNRLGFDLDALALIRQYGGCREPGAWRSIVAAHAGHLPMHPVRHDAAKPTEGVLS